jgi:uncharacterized protein (TIGR03000 family)
MRLISALTFKGRAFWVALTLLAIPDLAKAEPPWYRGHVHIGPENAYTRSIPGSFNQDLGPPDWAASVEYYYNWPTLRQALDEYGWFGHRYHKRGPDSGPSPGISVTPIEYPPAEVIKSPEPAAPARIRVDVPEQARIWFDDQATVQTGTTRLFVTGPLKPGHDYVYQVKARWKSGDKEINRTLAIHFKAGEEKSVSFVDDATAKK